MDIATEIKKNFKGEIYSDEKHLEIASRDASIFMVKPALVVAPKDAEDLKALVHFASEKRQTGSTGGAQTGQASQLCSRQGISLTARAAGTDMTGGPLSESIIVDFLPHFNRVRAVGDDFAVTEPGVYYRDFEKETLKRGLILPSYPASRDLCTVGGMTANNAGGEKTLLYGKTEKYVKSVKMVCADGNELEFKPLPVSEIAAMRGSKSFFSEVHRRMFELLAVNYEKIKSARPDVSKNSAGYSLWNCYDKAKGIIDLTKIIVGSQGTLGLITEITFALVKPKKYSSLLIAFLPSLAPLARAVNRVLAFKPESVESFDDHTFRVALKLFPSIAKKLGGTAFTLFLKFLPEFWMAISGGVPKLVLIAEFRADASADAFKRAKGAMRELSSLGLKARIARSPAEAKKYWTFRRESFNLLRQHMKNLRTAPFIDDFAVRPEHLPEFLPKLYEILSHYKILYTIAGHAGDGNFHIIPLLDLRKPETARIVKELSESVYRLVLDFKGTITGEHNDGLIRSSYLPMMYGEEVMKFFEETKKIFDPQGIFNPGKKVEADKNYPWEHIDRE